MLKSFKDYRAGLNEAGSNRPPYLPPLGTPRPAWVANLTGETLPVGGLDSLEQEILRSIQLNIETMKKDLQKRNDPHYENPFDVMRKNLPIHHKLRNWWNRFWNNDTASESTEYKLEFSGLIGEQDGAAFQELVSLFEEGIGPVGQALDLMYYQLDRLESSISQRIKTLFARHKSEVQGRQQQTPETPFKGNFVNAVERDRFDKKEPPPEFNPPQDEEPSHGPDDHSEPEDDPVLPDDGHPGVETPEEELPPIHHTEPDDSEGDQPLSKEEKPQGKAGEAEDVAVGSVKEFGLVKKVLVGGKWYRVSSAKYDDSGNLVSVGCKDRKLKNGIVEVPKELGIKAKINYGKREGDLKDIVADIINNPSKAPEVVGKKINVPPPLPPRDREDVPPGGIDLPDSQTHSSDHINDDDIDWSADDDFNTMKKVNSEQGAPKTPVGEKVHKWLDKEKDHVNPHLLTYINGLDEEGKESLYSFIGALDDSARYAVCFPNNGGLMDTPSEDMGKVLWVAHLDPDTAKELGEKINEMDTGDPDDLLDNLRRIFKSEEDLHDFANGKNEGIVYWKMKIAEGAKARAKKPKVSFDSIEEKVEFLKDKLKGQS